MKSVSFALLIILFPAMLFMPLSIDAQPLEKEIKIGLIPEINVFEQMKRYKHIGSYLTGKTGIKVSFSLLTHYGNVLNNYKDLGLDGAFLGSFTAALAREKLDISPVARPVNINGTSTYQGYIFTRKDSGIKVFKDLKGKVMAYVDKATTAGYIFPVAYLRQNGVTDIEGFFSEYFFTGSHDASITAVLGKKADIGAAKNAEFTLL